MTADYERIEKAIQNVIESGILFEKEKTKGVWMKDSEGKISNIVLEISDNEWNINHFSFIDMTIIEKGLTIGVTFISPEDGIFITYQKTYNSISQLLIDNSIFKKFLNYIKTNKSKIQFEELEQDFFMDFGDDYPEE
mgnify:CR=1 FL=1